MEVLRTHALAKKRLAFAELPVNRGLVKWFNNWLALIGES
jgi:hypothetical protein